MIVTRQRKKKQSSLPILLPIAAIAMLVIALTWPPSRNFITNGPLKPVATVFDGVWGVVSRPLSFSYQQQQITDRNQEIKALNDKLESDRKASDDKDAQVAQLQKQLAAANAQPEAATPAPAVALAGQAAGAAQAAQPAGPGRRRPRRMRSGGQPSSGRPWTPKTRPPSCRSCPTGTSPASSPRCRPTRSARSWMLCRPKLRP